MKISFVIPAYNEEKYIGKCLEAITRLASASGVDFEIIVANNASTDSTKEVALSFPGVMVVDEPRKGITFARKAGFEKSTGELIAHVDADSVLTPEWIPMVLKKFSEDNKLVCLSGPFVYYDLSLLSNIGIRLYYYAAFAGYLINRFVLRVSSLVQGGNFVTTREAITKIGSYDTSISFYGEDTDLARRLNSIGHTVFSFELPVYSSGRRIRSEGLLTMAIKYPLNYWSTIVFKHPFTTTYADHRQKNEKTTTSIRQLTNSLRVIFSLILIVLVAMLYIFNRHHL